MRPKPCDAISCQRGTAAIEFAIIATVLITITIGLVDFGRTLYVQNQLSYLADRAARTVLLNPAVTNTQVSDQIEVDFTAGDVEDLEISLQSQTISGVEFRVMTITYPITLFIPNITSSMLDLDIVRRVPSG